MTTLSRRKFIQTGMGLTILGGLTPLARVWAAEQGTGFGLPSFGKITPRASKSIAASSFSVGFETLDRKHFDPKKTYELAGQLGVKWARCQTGWARTESVKGKYDFAWLDEVVDSLRGIGIQPWFNLGYGNPLYTPKADATAVGWVPVFEPAAMQAWLRFTRAIAEHFHDRVRYWEIWNEPNITGFWKPGKPDAAKYTELVKQTAPEIRQRVPQSVIIGGSFARIPQSYIDQCLAAGLADHVDKISYHPYRPRPEQDYTKEIETLRGSIAKYKKGIGLWQGENGAPSKQGGAGALKEFDWNEERQAKWLLRRLLNDVRLGIELTSYFLIVDLIGYRGSANWKGILRGETYEPKPSYYAYQNLCALFDSETKLTANTLSITSAAEGIQTASFERGGVPVCAYWSLADLFKPFPAAKISARITGDKIQSPVLADLLTGQIYTLEAAGKKDGAISFENLPLTNHPLVLTDRTLVA
ncbi:MAG: beta-galactosidase [Kiritimatiellaeota bacterium]|nr:beta-galactosidase [Kiritimatiellota bacterium]